MWYMGRLTPVWDWLVAVILSVSGKYLTHHIDG